MAAGLLIFMGIFERHGGHVPTLCVDPKLALPDLHFLHGAEALVCVVLDKGLYGIVWEVHHAEEPYCKGDLVRDIPHVDRIELSLPDCLHLATDAGDPDPVEAEGPGRLLEPGDLGTDIILRPLCLEDVLAAHRDEWPGLPWSVALACHNSPIDYPCSRHRP